MADVRVILVDDHAVVREGYRRLLECASDIDVIAEVSSGEEAYRSFCETQPDVVVMDLSLPGMSGIEATRRIVTREARASILIFSMHDDAVFGTRALQAGARGYITKASAPDVLVEATNAVARGRIYISHDMAQVLAMRAVPGREPPLDALSPREFEVFRLLVAGKPLSEIATILSVGLKTVMGYQSNILKKLEADTAAQIVWVALKTGLFDSGNRK